MMMVNICDDDCYLVMKVILVKEVMSCDVSPVKMFLTYFILAYFRTSHFVYRHASAYPHIRIILHDSDMAASAWPMAIGHGHP